MSEQEKKKIFKYNNGIEEIYGDPFEIDWRLQDASKMIPNLDTIDTWLNRVAKGRANVDPATIPWDALRTLIKQSVYGGRVDSDFDQRILDAFVDMLFTPAAYNVDFNLVPSVNGGQGLETPDGTKLEHFLSWVHGLPDREPPAWLSLPPTAERVIAVVQGSQFLTDAAYQYIDQIK